jgi:hypothetical protein
MLTARNHHNAVTAAAVGSKPGSYVGDLHGLSTVVFNNLVIQQYSAMSTLDQIPYVKDISVFANFFDKKSAKWLGFGFKWHSQKMCILELGKTPSHIRKHIGYFKSQEAGHVAIDRIECKHIKIFVIEINQAHHFKITTVLVTYDYTPIQWHLNVEIANLNISTWATEYIQKHQWWPIVVYMVMVTVIQHTVA